MPADVPGQDPRPEATASQPPALAIAARTLALLLSVWYIGVFLVLAAQRLVYPYELEWMEGGMVDHVQRVLHGQSLYVAPSLDFVPYNYPPLYSYLSAGLAAVTGNGFLPLRLLAIVATLGSFACIYWIVQCETGRRIYSFIAVGVFAATYHAGGAWLDLGRLDSLFLLLVLAPIYLIRRYDTRAAWIAAGLLLAAAAFTKQTAFVIAGAIFLYGFWTRPARAWPGAAVFALSGVATLVIANAASHGWYWYYVFAQPSQHPLDSVNIRYFLTRDVLAPAGIAFVAALYAVLFLRAEDSRHTWRFFSLVALGMLLAAFIPRAKAGGYVNNLIPAYAILTILLLLTVAALEQSRAPRPWQVLLWPAVVVQLVLLFYDPRPLVPTSADRMAGDRFIEALRQIPGDVWVINHGYYGAMAGKAAHAQSMAVHDLLAAQNESVKTAWINDFVNAVRQRRFAAFVLDTPDPINLDPQGFDANYTVHDYLFADTTAFWPVTGAHIRPRWVLVCKPDSTAVNFSSVNEHNFP